MLATGIAYLPGEPVKLRVRVRRFPQVDDGGRAVELAGGSERLSEIAERVAREYVVNVSRRGVVSLPAVPAGPGFDAVADRVARASAALFEELLEVTETD